MTNNGKAEDKTEKNTASLSPNEPMTVTIATVNGTKERKTSISM